MLGCVLNEMGSPCLVIAGLLVIAGTIGRLLVVNTILVTQFHKYRVEYSPYIIKLFVFVESSVVIAVLEYPLKLFVVILQFNP